MLAESLIVDSDAPLAFHLVGTDWLQHKVDRSVHGHQEFDWLQTIDGVGEIEIDHRKITLAANQSILFHPRVPHAYRPLTSEWHTSFLSFSGTIAHELTTSLGLDHFLYFTELTPQLANFIPKHFTLFADESPEMRMEQSIAVYRFLLLIRENNNATDTYYDYSLFKPIIDYIDTHYAEPITNADFCAITGYSAQHQSKLFREYYGMTPLQYLTNYRIKKAKALLMAHDDWQIQTIAARTGFTDISRFIQAFKRDTGYTPLRYRNCHQFG
ncbi:helix-turn-helix transcriptional regulator [Lacticaseibacillus sp. GG6-2]